MISLSDLGLFKSANDIFEEIRTNSSIFDPVCLELFDQTSLWLENIPSELFGDSTVSCLVNEVSNDSSSQYLMLLIF
jgi:hypothetical protein